MTEMQISEWQEGNVNFNTDNERRETTVEPAELTDEIELTKTINEQSDIKECEPQKGTLTNDKVQEDDTNSILKSISELGGRIDQMNQLFIQRIQRTEYEEKIVDQMHAELQKYKEDMYAQLVRPILLDIIEIRESIRRISANYAAKPEAEQCIPLKTFRDYAFDMQDVLEKNNITIFESKEGDEFISLKQRAIKKVITSAEELHGKIAESMSSGYDYMGKTISPEKVAVYIYQKPEITEGENVNG